jgi:hypothetical protein
MAVRNEQRPTPMVTGKVAEMAAPSVIARRGLRAEEREFVKHRLAGQMRGIRREDS